MSLNNGFDGSSELECDGKPRGDGRNSQSKYKNIPKRHVNNTKPVWLIKPDFSIVPFQEMSTQSDNEHLRMLGRFASEAPARIDQDRLTETNSRPFFNPKQYILSFVADALTKLEEEREKNLEAQLNNGGGIQQQSGSGGQVKMDNKGASPPKKERRPSYVPNTTDFKSFAELKTRYPFASTERLESILSLQRLHDAVNGKNE